MKDLSRSMLIFSTVFLLIGLSACVPIATGLSAHRRRLDLQPGFLPRSCLGHTHSGNRSAMELSIPSRAAIHHGDSGDVPLAVFCHAAQVWPARSERRGVSARRCVEVSPRRRDSLPPASHTRQFLRPARQLHRAGVPCCGTGASAELAPHCNSKASRADHVVGMPRELLEADQSTAGRCHFSMPSRSLHCQHQDPLIPK